MKVTRLEDSAGLEQVQDVAEQRAVRQHCAEVLLRGVRHADVQHLLQPLRGLAPQRRELLRVRQAAAHGGRRLAGAAGGAQGNAVRRQPFAREPQELLQDRQLRSERLQGMLIAMWHRDEAGRHAQECVSGGVEAEVLSRRATLGVQMSSRSSGEARKD